MRLLLRCDAGPTTGVGHAVRCAAVAEAAGLAGHDVHWSGRLDGLDWLWSGLTRPGGAETGTALPSDTALPPDTARPPATVLPPGIVLPPADTAADLVALCRDHRIDAVHVDHYLLGTDLRAALNAAGTVLSTVEDFGTGRRPGDVVVDPNLGSQNHPRPDDGSPVLLRGPRYAPLRATTRRARARRADLVAGSSGAGSGGGVGSSGAGFGGGSSAPRVLVVMGGTDAAGLLPTVVDALRAADVPAEVDVVVPAGRTLDLPPGGPARFRAVPPDPDLPAAMAAADLVVSAAGTTVWELCCVGVPMALVRVVDNQAEGYRTVVAAGAAAGLGSVDDLRGSDTAAGTLRALLTDPARRNAMAGRARTVVDGDGAGRIVDAITAAITGAGSDAGSAETLPHGRPHPDGPFPGDSLPGSSPPGNSQPGSARPGNSPPGSARPGNSLPGSARSGASLPGGPALHGPAPGRPAPGVPAHTEPDPGGPAGRASGRPTPVLRARPATLDDAEQLLVWRNDPDTRRWSRSSDTIDLDAHRRWLAGSLERVDRHLLVVSDDDGPVGTVRWDRDCAGWEVSITVAPDRRGRGLAGPLLRAGEDALREWIGAGTPVTATVHGDNAASLRLFTRAGYRDGPGDPTPDGFHTLQRIL